MHLISRTRRRFTHGSLSRRCQMPLALACASFIAIGAACSSSSGSSAASGGPKPGPNVITADEIAHLSVQNAYEAVQKLRPAMLRPRQIASANGQGGVSSSAPPITGTTTVSGQVVVYSDGTRLGDVEQLRGITASSIASVRYYSASEAQTKWGSGHAGGAIEVITKR